MITLRRLATVLTAMVVMVLIYAGAALAQPAERIFFVGGGGCSGGCSMNLTGTDKRALFPSSAVGGRLIELEASPDGTKLIYTHAGSTDIHVSNADGSGRTNLTNTPDAQEISPTWSPDGKQIAYTRSDYDAATNCQTVVIWKMNANGSGKVPLTTRPCSMDDHNPDWSPDGSKIVFERVVTSTATTYNRSLYTMKPDGSGQTRLTDGVFDRAAQWSPDGSKIAYAHASMNDCSDWWSISTINADGSGKTPLTNPSCTENDSYPQWAPAGDKIAFDRDETEGLAGDDIWTVTADGSAKANITNSPTEWEELLDWAVFPAHQVWYDIPDLYDTDARVHMRYFDSPGESSFTLKIDNRYGRYNGMYVQAKPIKDDGGRDGFWKRTSKFNISKGGPDLYVFPWYDTTVFPFHGYKFRLCRDIRYEDKCGKASRTWRP